MWIRTGSRRRVWPASASRVEIYGLPIDNWAPLWHINMNYFRQAGLVKDGKPILPRSPEELLAQARQFKQATGKPYFVQALSNERAAYTRNLYTLLMQQSVDFFADPQKVKLQSPEAKQVVDMFRQIYVGRSHHEESGLRRRHQRLHQWRRRRVSRRHVDDRRLRCGVAQGRAAVVERLRRHALAAALRARRDVHRRPRVGDAGEGSHASTARCGLPVAEVRRRSTTSSGRAPAICRRTKR